MNKDAILDEYFIETRHKLLDVAAFMDRVDRAGGREDFRWKSFIAAIDILGDDKKEKTRRIQELMSDPSTDPVAAAPVKGATGAWPDFAGK